MARIGWFQNFHASSGHVYVPTTKTPGKNVTLGFKLFAHYVWYGPPKRGIITKALIMDINSQQWDITLPFLLELKFNNEYHQVRFIH